MMARRKGERIYRHRLLVRIAHWLTVFIVPILIGSGLQIFNAHPALYWGNRSDPGTAFLSIEGFPGWATIPSSQWLAMGRRWHLFFGWAFVILGAIFALYCVLSGHLRENLLPRLHELRRIGATLKDHLRFRHLAGQGEYNVLQKITYLGVIFALAPILILSGLAMSPMLDAQYGFLSLAFGGRQSARSIHFMACFLMIGFIATHLFMVIATGFWNNLRSMVTGWFRMKAPTK